MQQKDTEYHLIHEKERYRVALQSSWDILLTYNLQTDLAEFYNLDGQGAVFVVESLKEKIKNGDFAHPEDRTEFLSSFKDIQQEVVLYFRSPWLDRDRNSQWFEFKQPCVTERRCQRHFSNE